MKKRAMYSSVTGFRNVIHVDEDSLKAARKFLEDNSESSEYVSVDRHYSIEGCEVIDLNSLGLRIGYDDETKFNSLVDRLGLPRPDFENAQVG